MAFIKLDCGILDSTLWEDRDARDMFITALLIAEPFELREPMRQIKVRSLDYTGFIIPPEWYGFARAAGVGIARRAGIDKEIGLAALERLGEPDTESRTKDHGGRRLVRVDGGYLVLNWRKHREKDSTAAERSKRWREREKLKALPTVTNRCDTRIATPDTRDSSLSEAEAEAEAERGRETAPPAPPCHIEKSRNRKGLAKHLRRLGLVATETSLEEWADLMQGIAGCRSVQDVNDGITWIMQEAEHLGMTVNYAKDARALATRLAKLNQKVAP